MAPPDIQATIVSRREIVREKKRGSKRSFDFSHLLLLSKSRSLSSSTFSGSLALLYCWSSSTSVCPKVMKILPNLLASKRAREGREKIGLPDFSKIENDLSRVRNRNMNSYFFSCNEKVSPSPTPKDFFSSRKKMTKLDCEGKQVSLPLPMTWS